MAIVAQYVARLTLSKSLSQHRWLCTAAEAAAGDVNLVQSKGDKLFHQLRSMEVKEGSSELSEVIDKWVADGVFLKRHHVVSWIVQLRRFHKYTNALQVSEWLEKSKFAMIDSDRAIRIDLISATKGIDDAEKYFTGLQTSAKTMKTYGALLSCYCRGNMTEKAVVLFEKMKDSGVTPTTLNMNQLMHLYLKVGQPEKVLLLVQELEGLEFVPDKYTYTHLMNSYADLKDYDGAEKVLEKITANKVKLDWFSYATLARIHINAGCFEKANDVLERMESIEKMCDPEAFQTLITLYAKTNNQLGVFRAWESLKLIQKNVSNNGYLSLLIALAELGDLDSLQKYFKEWELSCSLYDMRICDVLLKFYLNRDMLTEAKTLADSLTAKEVKPTFRTLTLFMDYHLKKSQTDIALQYLEQGAVTMKQKKYNDWFPAEETVKLFLNLFKENRDAGNAQTFFKIMKDLNRLDSKISDALFALGCRI
uniref:Pentatricopeptide repeat-containing protein n=1 Tax=Kalanchoe fedtschenkoi TaxID=63787 RepID=A0A7N0TF54_KALFE